MNRPWQQELCCHPSVINGKKLFPALPMLWAFVVGGLICVIGQLMMDG
ncbi:SpoVA/SpoVAEb family sporulation membrane protein [Polycladomyces sp. WAk]|uniref:SpoVA/SpoVAEb family sporulation membrane protein n=1 Tax=Polycladomyces zharkentensis TaxID=2807616 RepID=A0ABS2WJA2_9BACL|nr:SpoVA/SpoVAEb family sporulation membrane protein [Polycladomyces sp. WAk]